MKVIAFSAASIDLFKANQGKINALGNATPILETGATTAWTFSFPITSITITPQLKIGSGSASGSALEIARNKFDDETGVVTKLGIVIANFTPLVRQHYCQRQHWRQAPSQERWCRRP